MPPKPKFTKEQMIDAAIELICEKGADRLTARELGKQLGSSSCPIFTLFKDMDEVKTEVKKRAVGVFKSYMAVAENYTPAYKKCNGLNSRPKTRVFSVCCLCRKRTRARLTTRKK